MAVNTEQLLETISTMSVMEVVQLIEGMEKKFGVSAQAAVAVAVPVAGGAAPAVEEQTEFNVIMTSFGANKVNVIKAVRAITSLGLKEAKDLVEGVPSTIKEGVTKDDAAKIKKELEEAGAVVDIK